MSTPPSTQTAGTVPSGTTQTINGVALKIRDKAPLVISNTLLHKLQNRDGMLSDKLPELFVKATRVQHTKYDLMSLRMVDQDKLDDTYNLEKNTKRTHQAMGNYEYDNVSRIVEQDKAPWSSENLVLTKTCGLFKDYAIMTPTEVAWYIKLYRTWTAKIWFEKNLKLSCDFFENHCFKALWEKTMYKYSHYSEEEIGGPLFSSSSWANYFQTQKRYRMLSPSASEISRFTRWKSWQGNKSPGRSSQNTSPYHQSSPEHNP
jgi:hypothetical protein